MTIPDEVKIGGRIYRPKVSARGHVELGDFACDIRDIFDGSPEDFERIKNASAHPDSEWHALMYKAFERVLQAERDYQHRLRYTRQR